MSEFSINEMAVVLKWLAYQQDTWTGIPDGGEEVVAVLRDLMVSLIDDLTVATSVKPEA